MIELTERELELAQFRIEDSPPGKCQIEDIYGEHWEAMPSHASFGRWFKAAVKAGRLLGMAWVERTSDNRQIYEILKGWQTCDLLAARVGGGQAACIVSSPIRAETSMNSVRLAVSWTETPQTLPKRRAQAYGLSAVPRSGSY